VHDTWLNMDMLYSMLDSGMQVERMGGPASKREVLCRAAVLIEGAKARLVHAADVARTLDGKDSAVGALTVVHSLLCLGGDSLESVLFAKP